MSCLVKNSVKIREVPLTPVQVGKPEQGGGRVLRRLLRGRGLHQRGASSQNRVWMQLHLRELHQRLQDQSYSQDDESVELEFV